MFCSIYVLIDQLMNSIVIYDHEDDYHKVNEDIQRDTYVEPVIRVFSIYISAAFPAPRAASG